MFDLDDDLLVYLGDKPSTPEEAKEISVQKWDAIYEYLGLGVMINDGGTATCGFCMFYLIEDGNCKNCPVYKKTGRELCLGNQYYQVYRRAHIPETARWYAFKEAEFLRSLEIQCLS